MLLCPVQEPAAVCRLNHALSCVLACLPWQALVTCIALARLSKLGFVPCLPSLAACCCLSIVLRPIWRHPDMLNQSVGTHAKFQATCDAPVQPAGLCWPLPTASMRWARGARRALCLCLSATPSSLACSKTASVASEPRWFLYQEGPLLYCCPKLGPPEQALLPYPCPKMGLTEEGPLS